MDSSEGHEWAGTIAAFGGGAARAPQATMNSRNQGALARATRSITAALFTLQLSFAALANPPVRAARADFERILARDTLRWLEEYGARSIRA